MYLNHQDICARQRAEIREALSWDVGNTIHEAPARPPEAPPGAVLHTLALCNTATPEMIFLPCSATSRIGVTA
jgi:hypothetical protein